MASTIQVDKVQDTGGNTILSSNSTGTFTNNLPANLTGATGTLAIAQGGTGAATLAAAGLANTPAFAARYGTETTTFPDATYTKLAYDTEVLDSASVYNTTNYRWTPGTVGYYFLYARVLFQAGSTSPSQARIAIYKNGSVHSYKRLTTGTTTSDWTLDISMIDYASSASDYYEIFGYQDNSGSSTTFTLSAGYENIFCGNRIIGV